MKPAAAGSHQYRVLWSHHHRGPAAHNGVFGERLRRARGLAYWVREPSNRLPDNRVGGILPLNYG